MDVLCCLQLNIFSVFSGFLHTASMKSKLMCGLVQTRKNPSQLFLTISISTKQSVGKAAFLAFLGSNVPYKQDRKHLDLGRDRFPG